MKWLLIMIGIALINIVLMKMHFIPFWIIFSVYAISVLMLIIITLVWQVEVIKKIHQQKDNNSHKPGNHQ